MKFAFTRSKPGRAWRRAMPNGAFCFSVFMMLGLGTACSDELSCNNQSVQDALRKALDKTYAEARQLARISFDVVDMITVRKGHSSAMCKAILKVNVTYLGADRVEDAVAPFTAERTESGNVIVTVFDR